MSSDTWDVRPMRVATAPESSADKGYRSRASLPESAVIARGLPETREHDLLFRGGQPIPHLAYVNFYVSGSSWSQSDIDAINSALEAAMTDERLNNVMAQYFPDGHIASTFAGSVLLDGPRPDVVSQGDVESLVRRLFRSGRLAAFDAASTVFNFLLPSGTLLTTDEAPTGGLIRTKLMAEQDEDYPIPHEEEDYTEGLGGYHGSVHISQGLKRITLYYAVGVYSERRPDGSRNGIVAFDRPWKNVVATFYHELNEARTDPDVEDAIKTNSDKFLGWTSKQGEECGDFPVFEANPLSLVFKEVKVTTGAATVPVQFQYSNAVHGPEGPIATPHPPLH